MKAMFWVFLILGIILFHQAWQKSPEVAWAGTTAGLRMLLTMAPLLLVAFLVAGLATELMPRELLAGWLGRDSGFKGIALGAAVGAVTPGGPFALFPLMAVLIRAGADVGPIVSFLSSWALLALHRVFMYEIPMLGWKFALVRLAVSLPFPILMGWAARVLWTRI